MKKLVRDKIPAVIKQKGESHNIYKASSEEFSFRLVEKLREEVDEFIKDPSVEELGDILEVLYALCELHKFNFAEVEIARKEKKNRLGAFDQKLVLEKKEI